MDEQRTRPRVYLIETMSDMEDDVLRTWLERQADDSGQPPPTVRVTDQALADLVRRKDDPLLTPLRVVWLPKETHPDGAQRLRETLSLRDPLHPGQNMQRRVMRDDPAGAKFWKAIRLRSATSNGGSPRTAVGRFRISSAARPR